MYRGGGDGRSITRGRGVRPGQNAQKPSAGSESATRPGLNSTGDYRPGAELNRRTLPPVVPQGEAEKENANNPNVQNATPAQRADILHDFATRLALHAGGSRGNEDTQNGLNILIQECQKVLEAEFPEIADRVVHSGGGNVDGNASNEAMKERFLRGSKGGHLGSSKPDASWELKGSEGINKSPIEGHINSATVRKSGRETKWERESFARLVDEVGEELATWLPKFRPSMDENTYRDLAREACRRVFRNMEKEARKLQETQKRRDGTVDKGDMERQDGEDHEIDED
jgi:hypothetical protein